MERRAHRLMAVRSCKDTLAAADSGGLSGESPFGRATRTFTFHPSDLANGTRRNLNLSKLSLACCLAKTRSYFLPTVILPLNVLKYPAVNEHLRACNQAHKLGKARLLIQVQPAQSFQLIQFRISPPDRFCCHI